MHPSTCRRRKRTALPTCHSVALETRWKRYLADFFDGRRSPARSERGVACLVTAELELSAQCESSKTTSDGNLCVQMARTSRGTCDIQLATSVCKNIRGIMHTCHHHIYTSLQLRFFYSFIFFYPSNLYQ